MFGLKHAAEIGVLGLGQKLKEMAHQVFDICSTATHRIGVGNDVCLRVSNLKQGWQNKKTLPTNILSKWPWRGCTKLVVVVFESDVSEEL